MHKQDSEEAEKSKRQISNSQHLLDHEGSKGIPEKDIYFCFKDYDKAFDCMDPNKLQNS